MRIKIATLSILMAGVLILVALFFYRLMPNNSSTSALLSAHLVYGKIEGNLKTPETFSGDHVILTNSNGEKIIIKESPIFTEKNFISFSLQKIEVGQTKALEFRLSEPAKKRFSKVTKENIGKQIAFVMKGKVISAAVVHEPITGGWASLATDNTLELYNMLSKVEKSRKPNTFCRYLPQFFHSAFECY